MEFTDGVSTPEIFRRWTALSTIAGALEQKVWFRINKRTSYPNLYVLLVGAPAVGKSEAVRQAEKFLRDLPNCHVAPNSVSRASLIDALIESERSIVQPHNKEFPVVFFNSITVCASEFGVFLKDYESDFISTMNKLFDCEFFSEKKRSMKQGATITIERPQLNMLAGTTPGWLSTNLPENAWKEGFTSRIVLVYGVSPGLTSPWLEDEEGTQLEKDLAADLIDINSMFGPMVFEREAKGLFTEWYMGGQPTDLDHPRLEHYIPRRSTQLVKMMMCLSASRSSDRVITEGDFKTALAMLTSTEKVMPLIFRDMFTNGDDIKIDEVWADIDAKWRKSQRPLAEYEVMQIIRKRYVHYTVRKVLDVMLESNMLKHQSILSTGGKPNYVPVDKKEWNPVG